MRLPMHATAIRFATPPSSQPSLQLLASSPTDWRADLPNALTIARVAAVPALTCAFYCRPWARARIPAAIFALCALTDWLDGYLARKWDVNSAFGAFLDPVADKVLVCTCLVLLSGALGAVVALPTAVIVCREVSVSALREWMGQRGERAAVAVGYAGKVKTAAQMVALQLLLLADYAAAPGAAAAAQTAHALSLAAPLSSMRSLAAALLVGACAAPMRAIGLALLYVATLLSCTSAAGYFTAAAGSLLRADGAAAADDGNGADD
jgi:CDP-diacylglycerol--glycerol-3-phosphate 3-phosphatidyltransferase